MNPRINKYTSIISALILLSTSALAQTASDALRYSQTFNGGTARFVSMGGAFGALGADFTSLSINPAGLGVYKSSEFTITPSFKRRSIGSTFNGTESTDSKNRFYLDNMGVVLSFTPLQSEEKGILNVNIGFGYTRTNDFHSNAFAKGNNNTTSIMRDYAIRANKYYCDNLTDADDYNPYSESGAPWDVIMAWNTFQIDTIANTNGEEYHAALNPGEGVTQKNITNTKGGSGEYDFSFAMNISNKLYIGATMGITDFSYTFNATYMEDAFESNTILNNGNRFYYSDYCQFYEVTGTGYNFKIGGIYTPTPSVRIGLGIHTPTFYSFDEKYSYIMKSNFDINGIETNFTSKSPLGQYEYHLETPFKFIGSFAYVFKNAGLISLDVEHIDYSTMKFRDGGDGYNFTKENVDIEDAYKSVINLRIGGEFKINDFAVRAGYAFYPSPYRKEFPNKDAHTSQISVGGGYRSGNFSLDMAYLHTMRTEKYKFYDMDNLSPVETKLNDGKFLVTLGFRF